MLPDCDNSLALATAIRLTAMRASHRRRHPAASLPAGGAVDLDVQIADLLAQRIAVDPQKVRGADLIAPGGGERRGQKRRLHFAQDAMIKAARGQPLVEAGKIAGEVS